MGIMIAYRRLLAIALPVVLENFLQALMGFVDGYLVAQLGLVALSGVAVANQVMAVYQAVFVALAAVLSGLLAQAKGQEKAKREQELIQQGLSLTIIVGLVLAILSIVAGKDLFAILGTASDVGQVAGLYLAYVGGANLLLGLHLTLSALARVRGLVTLPLWVSFLTNLLNLCLSAWAIFGLNWGVMGVALATVMARLLGLVFLLNRLELFGVLFQPNWLISRQLLNQFIPALAERLMMRLGDVVTLALITGLGTKVLAANSFAETLSQFNYLPALGLSTAVLILVAEDTNKNCDRGYWLKRGYLLAASSMLMISGGIYFIRAFLLGLFTSDAQVLGEAKVVLLYSCLGSPVTAGVLLMTGFWQALGQSQLPFYATSIGMWLIRIGLGYLFIHYLGLGLTGLWLATILDNLWRVCYLLFYYLKDSIKAGS